MREADGTTATGGAVAEVEAAVTDSLAAELQAIARLMAAPVGASERLEALTRVLAVSDRLQAAAVSLAGEGASRPGGSGTGR